MTTVKNINFEASARLQRLIGRDLVPNEEMAIVELVKNAYDSGARKVRIAIQPETRKEPSTIQIIDNGSGMSLRDLEDLFMFAGFSSRPGQVDRSRRTPTGEKGIGRFAADKLGKRLDVYTKTKSDPPIHLHVNWEDFDSNKKFNEVQAKYSDKVPSTIALGPRGTLLVVSGLRFQWQSRNTANLKAWLGDLLNPFDRPSNFEIELEVAGDSSGIYEVKPARPNGDVTLEVFVTKNKVRRTIRKRGAKQTDVDETSPSSADLTALDEMHARFVHFDRRPTKEDTHGLEPGVRIYRDGFRIEPFGSRTADWLQVAEHRAKRAGHAHVVPNRLFGFVEISRKANPDLGDTTSRQALLDTEAARNLVTVLKEQLSALDNVLRKQAEPRWRENRLKQLKSLEQARLHTLGEVAAGIAHELRQPLQAIRTEADNIKARLGQLGLVDGDISGSQANIDRNVVRINNNIELVAQLAKGNYEVAERDLAAIVRSDVGVFQNKAKAAGTEVKLECPEKQTAIISETAVQIALQNILTNALQAIQDTRGHGSISVRLKKTGALSIVEVDDNGGGVPDAVRDHLFQKMTTKKTGGMGVGLHFCKIAIEATDGQIGFTPISGGSRFWLKLPGEKV